MPILIGSGENPLLGREPLRSLAEINELTPAALSTRPPAVVRGVVSLNSNMLVIEAGGLAIPVAVAPEATGPGSDRLPRGELGAFVELTGHVVSGGYAPTLVAERIRVVGREPLPPALPADFAAMFRGDCELQRVTFGCVVQDVARDDSGRVWKLVVDAEARKFTVAIDHAACPAPPVDLIDAEVQVRGMVVAIRNSRGEFVSPQVIVAERDDIQIIVSPPADPFAAGLVPLAKIAAFRDQPRTAHRIRTQGTVSRTAGRIMFIEDGDIGIRVALAEQHPARHSPAPGDRVDVAGFVDMTRLLGGLIGAVVRRIESGPAPKPLAVAIPEITRNDTTFRDQGWMTDPGSYDSRLVRCRGIVETVETLPTGVRVALGSAGVRWFVDWLMPTDAPRPRLNVGAEVEATGIMQIDLDSHRLGGILLDHPAITRIVVLCRQLDDITVVRSAPWWTVGRLGLAAVSLAVVAGGFAAWSLALGREVRRQTGRAVAAATARQREQDEYEVAIRERSRIAADLHDTLLQTITGIGYQMRICRAAPSKPVPQELVEPLRMAERLVGHACRQLRSTVWSLRSMPDLRQPLPTAVEALVRTLAEGQGVAVEVTSEGATRRVPEPVARQLLFVVQEAFLNAVHHGGARRVTVAINFPPGVATVEIAVADEGRGFVVGSQPGPEAGHFGIQGMRERAELLAGGLRIESAPGRGTTVIVRVPCSEETPAAEDA